MQFVSRKQFVLPQRFFLSPARHLPKLREASLLLCFSGMTSGFDKVMLENASGLNANALSRDIEGHIAHLYHQLGKKLLKNG